MLKTKHTLAGLVMVLAGTQLWTTPVMADLATAQSYLKEAQELISNRDYEKATAKLELAEVEAEDAPAAAKAPVTAAIQQARQDLAAQRSAADKPKFQRKLRNLMDDAESGVGNLVIWPGIERQLTELFADPGARAVLPAEIATAEKKFATFRKLHLRKAGAELGGRAQASVQALEALWKENKALLADADTSPNSRESALEKIGREATRTRELLAQLPADEDGTKALLARVEVVTTEFTTLGLGEQVKEVLERLQRYLDGYADDFKGWEKEAATPAPTWAAFTHETSASMSAFRAPRTVAFRDRTEEFLKSLQDNQSYQAVASAPPLKAYVEGVRGQHKQAFSNLLGRIQPLVAVALKTPIKDPSDLDRLGSAIRLALGEESPEGKALRSKLDAQLAAHAAASTGAEEAQQKLVTTLQAKAEEVWPGLIEGLAGTTEINLQKPGQAIRFTSDNLMGYRFKPGDFYFATTIKGFPVAARFDPSLKAAIDALEAKIGRSLGDNDDDGKWEVFAVVTKQKARLLAKRQAEAKGTIDGIDVKIEGEYAEPVEAVILDIVAARCGPFAGSKAKGILRLDGSVGK
jgi:hypothetical protein